MSLTVEQKEALNGQKPKSPRIIGYQIGDEEDETESKKEAAGAEDKGRWSCTEAEMFIQAAKHDHTMRCLSSSKALSRILHVRSKKVHGVPQQENEQHAWDTV
jgi:hypothetical protein